MMSSDSRHLLALLRAGLWGSREITPTDIVDWSAVMKLAQRNAVLGTLCDGIEAHQGAAPGKERLNKLLSRVIRIERQSYEFHKVLAELITLFKANGIKPVLLKGLGVARNYPNPQRRQSGDIDLYLSHTDYRRGCELLRDSELTTLIGMEDEKHQYFVFKNIMVELHRYPLILFRCNDNRRFQQWSVCQLKTDTQECVVNEKEVTVPGLDFDAVYIFGHLYQHFLDEGVGLRQLCDWVMFLNRNGASVVPKQLEHNLKSFGLFKGWERFSCIAVDHLGLEREKMLFYNPQYRKQADIIIEEIIHAGNFGKHRNNSSDKHTNPVGKQLTNILRVMLRSIRLFAVLPKDSIAFLNFYLLRGVRRAVRKSTIR